MSRQPAREKLITGLRQMLEAIEEGALDPQEQKLGESPFMTLDEACLALGIRADTHDGKVKGLKRKARGKGYVRRDGHALVIERRGCLAHIKSMRAL